MFSYMRDVWGVVYNGTLLVLELRWTFQKHSLFYVGMNFELWVKLRENNMDQ